jgi:nuclease S1
VTRAPRPWLRLLLATLVVWPLAGVEMRGWGAQGHRLVALLAARELTPMARQNVQRLLGEQSLADVAVWADDYLVGNNQTSFWHYVNIPREARSYDRDRDCPRQPGVSPGARGDVWRDCIVDRIRYHEERLADPMLDRIDRAVALKFLVHFVGDIHQPWHASAIERGGNGIPVRFFGSETCGGTPERPTPCNMHAVWDTQLIARQNLSDRDYVAQLERRTTRDGLRRRPLGSAADWAVESLVLSNAALLAPRADVDAGYASRHMPVIEERLALGGIRLAAVLNRSLAARIR